jgi:arsenate reductase
MITIYGIKNCDTMQKGIKWLQAKGLAYTFHDYRESGIDKPTLELWLKHFPVNKLVNVRSTTYKELTDVEKASIESKPKAIALMMKYSTVIKRPVWDFGDGRFFLGWDEKALNEMVTK